MTKFKKTNAKSIVSGKSKGNPFKRVEGFKTAKTRVAKRNKRGEPTEVDVKLGPGVKAERVKLSRIDRFEVKLRALVKAIRASRNR